MKITKITKIIFSIFLAIPMLGIPGEEAQSQENTLFLEEAGPQPINQVCPIAEKPEIRTSATLYAYAEKTAEAYRCANRIAQSLIERSLRHDEAKQLYAEELRNQQQVESLFQIFLAEYKLATGLSHSNAVRNLELILTGPNGLAYRDRTSIHSNPLNRYDTQHPENYDPNTWQGREFRKALRSIAGEEADKILDEAKHDPSRYGIGDFQNPIKRAREVQNLIISKIRAKESPYQNLFHPDANLNWVITKENHEHNHQITPDLYPHKFLCRFQGKRLQAFNIYTSGEGREYIHTEFRCFGSNSPAATHWLAAFKEERAGACHSENPEISKTKQAWMKPRCLHGDNLERIWLSDGTIPLSTRYRRYGKENLEFARKWVLQAQNAQNSLDVREELFHRAILDCGNDPRIAALLAIFAGY